MSPGYSTTGAITRHPAGAVATAAAEGASTAPEAAADAGAPLMGMSSQNQGALGLAAGDVISINEKFGWVQELNARYVVVRDRDGVEALIPNENLITTEFTNWS